MLIERMTGLVKEAEGLGDPREVLASAVLLLAEAVVSGEEVDGVALERLGVRFASHVRKVGGIGRVAAGHRFLEALQDHRDHGWVRLDDGRVATPRGWDTGPVVRGYKG